MNSRIPSPTGQEAVLSALLRRAVGILIMNDTALNRLGTVPDFSSLKAITPAVSNCKNTNETTSMVTDAASK